MFYNQLQPSTKHGVIAVIILLNFFILVIPFIFNWNSLWILILTGPLLFFALYGFRRKKLPGLRKYFMGVRQLNVNRLLSERVSYNPIPVKVNECDLSITIGNDGCSQPFKTSLYSIGTKKIFNKAAIQKTIAEEELTAYSLMNDQIVQIGPEYSGCRTKNGGFDSNNFKQTARRPSVKMIELNLSMRNESFPDVVSSPSLKKASRWADKAILPALGFTVFSDAEGMIHFLDTLRDLSGKKPVGIRLSITSKKEFYKICHAIVKSRLIPDFIVVEGADINNVTFVLNRENLTLYDALLFVSKTLHTYGLEKEIRIIASANVISGFDIMKMLALGANAVFSEIPRSILRSNSSKSANDYFAFGQQDIADFHHNVINAFAQMMEASGFRSIDDITLPKLFGRLDVLFSINHKEEYNSITDQRYSKISIMN
ncbi:MAG: glutamate synthase-related protein [Chitinophagaceae bacterium]